MKKVSISHFVFSIFCLVLSLALFSCTGTGLGEEVDLEAPVLTVKSLESGGTTLTEFAGGVYCKKQITFSGTATDNNRVERVIAQVKWANDENADYVTYSTAQFSDPNWSCTINFEKEGACYVKLAAQDDAKNVSPKSTKVITLFVDDTAPVASAWYIDREVDGIQYNLRALDTLKAVNLDLAENKDAAQNVGFTICANANDTMGIKAISIQIRDETGKKICDIPKIDDVSLYAPKFKVTHDILVNGIDGAGGDASLAHGKHYLQVWYDSEDVITIPSSNVSNDVAVELGWFLWWPESDLPRVTNSEIKDSATDSDGIETGTLNVHVKDSLSLSLFDDDELKQAYFALFTDAEWENYANSFSWSAIESNPKVLKTHIEKADGEENLDEAQANRYKEFTANGERETVISLKTVKDPQRMHLVAIGWDINIADETLPIKPLVKRYITVNVTDESTPILIISSPKNNSIPTVASTSTETSAPVTVSGLTLSAAECQYLEFVWVPDSVANKRAAAESWLKTIEGTTAHDAVVSGTTKDGMKIWKAPLTSSGSQDGFIKSTFSFDFNLLTDFGNDKALDKYFLAKLTRKDGNYIYQDYKLAADNLPPTIEANITDGVTIEKTSAFTLKFKGTKTSGLPMKKSSYKITRIDVSPEEVLATGESSVDSNGYCTYTISEETLDTFYQKTQPKYRFYVEDIFGNVTKEQYTIIVDALPELVSIDSSAGSKNKLGKNIDIVATFSKVVAVSGGTPTLKLTGFTNSGKSGGYEVPYSEGSGTTKLHFIYTVANGDLSDGLTLGSAMPISANKGLANVTMNNISANTFNGRKIQVDGVPPTITTAPTISVTGEVTNDGVKYLKEGSTITVKATITSADGLSLQGNPGFEFIADGSTNKTLNLPFTTFEASTKEITFSKTLDAGDTNGVLTYLNSSYITDAENIKDTFDNSLLLSGSGSTNPNITVDTEAPKTPTLKAIYKNNTETLVSGKKYSNAIKFTLTRAEADSTIKSLQYSKNGGTTWLEYTSEVTLTENCSLTYRAIDYAGNISDIPDAIDLDIKNAFPSYTVECLQSDGYYGAGTKLPIRVTFSRTVSISANAAAYIKLTGTDAANQTYAMGANGGKTEAITTAQNNVDYIDFTYVIQDPDEFDLRILPGDVVLTGVTDEYGIAWSESSLTETYGTGRSIHCDGVSPKVISMKPTNETASGSNIYAKGKEITLTFNEAVQKANGNITIRRTAGWSIPPVLTASEFTAISNKITSTQKNILSLQENGIDMEDSESLYQATVGNSNRYYHGTGQYAGPYKKSTQGLNSDGTPDVSTKYVLDFDLNIDDTSNTAHYYGKTFSTTGTATSVVEFENDAYATTSTGESIVPQTPKNARTVQQLREVLEAAHYHERVIDVTSSYVTLSNDGKTVTIKFPNGLVGDDDLPAGREWELVIDKGTFMDSTGNYFGADAVGVIEKSDARQSYVDGATGKQTEISSGDKWLRGRASTTSPVVLVQTANGKDSFWSSGVAAPVVRVDRYSYGFGVYQTGSNGQKQSSYVSSDTTTPTGYVRVRIDCETPGATLTYGSAKNTATESNATIAYNSDTISKAADSTGTYSATTLPTVSSYTTSYTQGTFFAGGSGSYNTACKQRIVAQATKNGSSETGEEGIFQTVVQFYAPYGDNGQCGALPTDKNEFSIRGTTGWAGEPYIAPYPLRDSQVGSPYLKRCYRTGEISAEAAPNYTPTSTVTKTITLNGWTENVSVATASELGETLTKTIMATITQSKNSTNFALTGPNKGNWTNFPINASKTFPSELLTNTTANGLYLSGDTGTYTITLKIYNDQTFSYDGSPHYDYYWCSFEILVDSSFSGYSWSNYQGQYSRNGYNWCKYWGFMRPGEYTKDTNMRNWA